MRDYAKEYRRRKELMIDRAGSVQEYNRLLREKSNAYEKTKRGFLMRAYRNMKSRIEGVQKAKHHLYEGKYLMPKEEFYKLALADESFHFLFKKWEESGYDRKLTPSPDRMNSQEGYYEWNIEWVTHSENSRRGTISRYYGV